MCGISAPGGPRLKRNCRPSCALLPQHRFVLKTDVKSYYASIGHVRLQEQLSKHIQDKGVLRLLWQYMHRCAERGGVFYDIERGISLGCPLSPLMGALFLQPLDERMEQLGLFYARYMDDIVVLAPSRVIGSERASRLYEQEPGEPCSSSRLGQYVQRWVR